MLKKKIDICLVVDRSGSLGNAGETINNALESMLEAIKKEPYLLGCEEYFTLVSFSDDMTKNVDFMPIEKVSTSDLHLHYEGLTNPAPALKYVVDKAYDRYYSWKDNGEEAFHPLIFFFTDGSPYPFEKYMPAYKRVAAEIQDYINNLKVLFVCAGYGEANIDNLKMITNNEDLIVPMSKVGIDKLSRFFSEIIPKTVTIFSAGGVDSITKTKTFDQIADAFRFFISN